MEIKLRCRFYRTYNGAGPGDYLISIYTGLADGKCRRWPEPSLDGMPQARAVVDDFGDLVIVRGWL